MRTSLFIVIALALGTAGCDRNVPDQPAPPAPTAAATTPAMTPAVPPTAAVATPAAPMTASNSTAQARVELKHAEGQSATGNLVLESAGSGGVRLHGTLEGLSPNGTHAFHIHENGDCTAADFTSAGGHFNPDGKPHGNPGHADHHVGDIFSVTADANGVAQVDATATRATLGDGAATDVLGKAVVLHAKPDDYTSQPAGDAGPRIACGVIQ